MKFYFFWLFIFLCSVNSLVAQNWELSQNKKGIKIFTRLAKGSEFKEFKAEVQIDAPLKSISETIMDVENYPSWCYKIDITKLLKREKDKVYYYYVSEAPPIVKKREAYYCNQLIIDEISKIVTIAMKTCESKNPIPSNRIRVLVSNGLWTLIPITTIKTKVIFEMQAEPGGAIPSWLANLVVVDSPFVTLDGLRERVSLK